MTTAQVRELRRLSPHANTLVVPIRSTPSVSPRGERFADTGLAPDHGAAARDGHEPQR